MGAAGARLNPVCTYNIYREVLGAGAAPTCCPHGGLADREFCDFVVSRTSAIVRGVGGGAHPSKPDSGEVFPIITEARAPSARATGALINVHYFALARSVSQV